MSIELMSKLICLKICSVISSLIKSLLPGITDLTPQHVCLPLKYAPSPSPEHATHKIFLPEPSLHPQPTNLYLQSTALASAAHSSIAHTNIPHPQA